MSPEQITALQALAGYALNASELARIDACITPLGRDDATIAAVLSERRKPRVVSLHITERGVRTLPVLPRHYYALLQCLKAAATQIPAWFLPTLAALKVPQEDQAAMADTLASAHPWLLDSDGLDIGTDAARGMLDLIGSPMAVPLALPACEALKRLAEVPDPVPASAVVAVLNQLEA